MRVILGLIVFCIGTAVGFLSLILELSWMPYVILVVMLIMGLWLVIQMVSHRKTSPSYDELAQQLFKDIEIDLWAIHNLIDSVDKALLRHQLQLICEDITTLLHKVAEKSPESQLTTGRFIRGNVDFILNDILPQYIEMQNTPRYFESPEKKMAEGHKAIEIFAKFLYQRIVKLELADDMRYDVAIEMLGALDVYIGGNPHNRRSQFLIEEKENVS